MKSLLLVVLSTHVLHATAFTVHSALSKPKRHIVFVKSISKKLHAEPPNNNNDEKKPTSSFETDTRSVRSSSTSTTTSSSSSSSPIKSSLFAERKLYVGESFEHGETIYSDLEASAELFVENEVEMKINNGGITKKVASELQAAAAPSIDDIEAETDDISEEENLGANEMNGTDDNEDEEEDTNMVVETSEETDVFDEISPPFEEEVKEDESTAVVEKVSSTLCISSTIPVPVSSSLEKDDEKEKDKKKNNGKVVMAAERVERALRLQVIAAAEEQKNFEDARAEAIRRAMALSPLSEQIAEKAKTKSRKDEVERAESILRGRMLLEGEIADEAATDDSLIGSIRSFFAPKKSGVKNTKADRKKIGAAMEQEAILRTRVQASTSDTYDNIMTESDEPEIRLSAEEAKLAAMGAATAEERFHQKSPEQERAVKERYGSQTSYQRALKIMMDLGMIEGDVGDSLLIGSK